MATIKSIEEKAKRYDEAVEKARKIHNEHKAQPFNVMLKVFPELKESEDEKIRKELLSFCQNRADNYPNDPKYSNIGNWIAWLEKQSEQNPAWSEEDKKMFDKLYYILALAAETPCSNRITLISDEESIELKNWLKSLRPQPHWKPSDKQMKAIEHICDGNYNVDLDILDSIYRDFKKLREE